MIKESKILYFAYGSNMNHEQMKRRCPDSKFISRVKLNNHKFVYDGYSENRGGSVGNVIPIQGKVVWGGLFEISNKDLSLLDYYEAYPDVYNRKIVEVVDDEGSVKKAWVYFKKEEKISEPSKEYLKIVKRGAIDCELPKYYIKNNL